MVERENGTKNRLRKELTWLGALLLVGLTILPLAIYLVGRAVFGEYGDGGLGEFYAELFGEFFSGKLVVWFLLLSPLLCWQLLRLTLWAFRRGRRHNSTAG